MRSQGPLDSHKAVVDALESTVRTWATPMRAGEEHAKSSKFGTFMVPDSLLTMGQPSSPDSWMMTAGGLRRSPFGDLIFYPSVPALLKRFRRDGRFLKEVTTSIKFYAVAQGKPVPVPVGIAEAMVKQLQACNVARLEALLKEERILREDPENHPQAPLNFILCLTMPCGPFLCCLAIAQAELLRV